MSPLEEIKEESNEDESSQSITRELMKSQYQAMPTIKDSVNEIIEYLKTELSEI